MVRTRDISRVLSIPQQGREMDCFVSTGCFNAHRVDQVNLKIGHIKW